MAVKSFKLFWVAHKWTGLALSLIFLCTATTGFLLLIKKKNDWIQPPTMEGAAGEPQDFVTLQQVFQSVLGEDHPDFRSVSDIDRIDFRPDERVHKVRSKQHFTEIQVDAVTGEVLSMNWRPSDLIESIHDGSFFGDWMHDWLMPLVSVGLVFLVFSGIWLWIEPMVRRRRRRKGKSRR